MTVRGTFHSALLAALLVRIRIEVVMVNVLWSVLASGVDVPAAIGHIVPPGFALVGEQNICAVVPSEPPVHALR